MGELWYGGKIYTMNRENERIEALFTEKGLIEAVGSFEELTNRYNDKIDKRYNLKGKTMYPGFVDSHMHLIGHGEKIIHLDLSSMTSPQQVKDALRERASRLKEGEWLIGEGWNENQWEDPRVLHRNELDEICPDHPMVLSRICRHALLANSVALEMAGVDRHTADPQGGVVMRDEAGTATGYFLDTAQDYIKKVIPEISEDELTAIIKTSIDDLYSYGLVGGHSEDLNYYGGFKKTYNAFQRGIDGNTRKFRAHLLVHHEVADDMVKEGLDYKQGTDFIEMGAVKIFSDGALGGRTAWLSQPYLDDPSNFGINIHSKEGLENLVKKAREIGMPVAVHAIGDKAVESVAKAIQQFPLSNGRKDRIIHAQIVNEEVLDLLEKLNVGLDIQPTFVASDFPWVVERIGEDRLRYAYPWKTFLERDIACAAGSDAPIENVNPLLGIQAAVLRKSSNNGRVYNKKEQLSIYEAVSLYTKGSAHITGHEHDRGKIAKGFTADFTVLDKDLFEVDPEQLAAVEVEMTIVDGEVMYQK